MTIEQRAIEFAESPRNVKRRLLSARSCLVADWRKLFRGKRYDADRKRMLSDCGRYALQWELRRNPGAPVCYDNQQTLAGAVRLVDASEF